MTPDQTPTDSDFSEESILKELADNSPIGILMVRDNSFVYANETSAQMLDIPLNNILQLSVEELANLLLGDESKRLLSKYYELTQGETHSQQGVFSFTDSEDRVRTIEITSQSLVFRGARVLQSFLKDVSENVESSVALAESELRYRSLFENSPNSLWEEDLSDTKRYIDELKASGVEDFHQYFSQNPDE
ncbi:MAG: PAS domain-containing protein, partial [Candidatus Thorarchaeota archaeon]